MVTAFGLVPLLVVGQTSFGTVTTTVGGQATDVIQNDPTLHQPDCNTMLTATWTTALTGVPCTSLVMWVTSAADCEAAPAGSDVTLQTEPQSFFQGMPMRTESFQFPLSSIVSVGAADGGTGQCGVGQFQSTFLICAAISVDTNTFCTTKQVVQTTVSSMTAASIIYDTAPPSAPTLDDAEALDTSVAVSYAVNAADSDAASQFVQVQIKGPTDSDFRDVGTSLLSTTTKQTINGLTDGVEYQFRVVAIDAANNVSAPSNVISATPVASSGFWGAYRADGGGAEGCAAAPGALGLALALAAFGLKRRRS